jgi:hypothetical protein
VFSWLANAIDAQHLINDVAEAGERISELVEASKQYSHMNGSPFDVVDLHRLLDSAIDVLSPALGTDIAVVGDYDPLLPGAPCDPSELTEAFTHIVSICIDAMRSAFGGGQAVEWMREHNPPTPRINRTIWSVDSYVSPCADLTPRELDVPRRAGSTDVPNAHPRATGVTDRHRTEPPTLRSA